MRYDVLVFDTGKASARQGPEVPSALPALALPAVAAEVVPPSKAEEVLILDFDVKAGQPKKEDEVVILDL